MNSKLKFKKCKLYKWDTNENVGTPFITQISSAQLAFFPAARNSRRKKGITVFQPVTLVAP